uniref:Uncharacterized protein n=1 Tax=Romanomermis culicivorax TaxID=13658 RepID=A0A915IYQ7_ROMCU
MIKEQVNVLRQNVGTRVQSLEQDIDKFAARWYQLKPNPDILESKSDNKTLVHAIEFIKEKKLEFNDLLEQKEKLCSEAEQFDLKKPEFLVLEEVKSDLEIVGSNWLLFEEFNNALEVLVKEDWISFRNRLYVFEEVLSIWNEKLRNSPLTHVAVRLKGEIEFYQVVDVKFY